MAYWILKAILTPLLRSLFRLDIRGVGNVPSQGPAVLASNHQSFIDSIFIPLVCNRRVTFVAKAEYFESIKTRWFFRAVGQIPIQRGGGPASERALASAREVLAAGGVLGIYPEGSRSADGRLYKGHTGVARLALGCRVPVVPVACGGTAAVQPIGAMFPRPLRRVSITFGPRLSWPDLEGVDDPAVLRRVTDEVMDAIGAMSGQERVLDYNRRGRPAGSVEAASAGADAGAVDAGAADAGADAGRVDAGAHDERAGRGAQA